MSDVDPPMPEPTVINCPVCAWSLDPEASGSVLSLLGVQVVGTEVERRVHEHLRSHPLEDWVRALAMADRYIEQLESENTDLLARSTALDVRSPAFPGQSLPEPAETRPERARLAPGSVRRDPNETLIPFTPVGERPAGLVRRKS